MRAILIKSAIKKVEFVYVPFPNSTAGHTAVRRLLECDEIEPLPYDDTHQIWVDKWSILSPLDYCFAFDFAPTPVCGDGLILGKASNGRESHCTLTVSSVLKKIKFIHTPPTPYVTITR